MLEYIESRPDLFVVLYWDEAGIRKRMYQHCAWVARKRPEHEYDERRETGKGPGFHVGAFLTNDPDNPIIEGFIDRVTGKREKVIIQDSKRFLNHMERCALLFSLHLVLLLFRLFQIISRNCTDRIAVCVFDGASMVLCFAVVYYPQPQ